MVTASGLRVGRQGTYDFPKLVPTHILTLYMRIVADANPHQIILRSLLGAHTPDQPQEYGNGVKSAHSRCPDSPGLFVLLP